MSKKATTSWDYNFAVPFFRWQCLAIIVGQAERASTLSPLADHNIQNLLKKTIWGPGHYFPLTICSSYFLTFCIWFTVHSIFSFESALVSYRSVPFTSFPSRLFPSVLYSALLTVHVYLLFFIPISIPICTGLRSRESCQDIKAKKKNLKPLPLTRKPRKRRSWLVCF